MTKRGKIWRVILTNQSYLSKDSNRFIKITLQICSRLGISPPYGGIYIFLPFLNLLSPSFLLHEKSPFFFTFNFQVFCTKTLAPEFHQKLSSYIQTANWNFYYRLKTLVLQNNNLQQVFVS